LRDPKGEMTVTIDESRHDPLLGGINDLHVVLIFELDIRRESPDTPNAVAFDDNGFVDRGRTSRAVDQGPVLNNERFSVTAVHRSLLSEQLFPPPRRGRARVGVREFRSRLHAGVPRVQHPITPTYHPGSRGCRPPRLDRAMLCPRVSHSKRVGWQES